MKLRPLVLALVLLGGTCPVLAQTNAARTAAQPAEALRYPQATRKAPAPKTSREGAAALNEALKAFSAQDYAGTLTRAQAFAAKASTPYETAVAWQLAGSAAFQTKDYANAAQYFQKAVEANGLDNNGHYDAMGNRASALSNAGQYAEALKALDAFLAESKSTDPQWQSLRNQLLARSGNPADAAKAYQDALAKNPNDQHAMVNLIAVQQAAKNDAEALRLMREAYGRGMLNTPALQDSYYSTLLQNPNANWREAEKVLDAGIANGSIPKGERAASAYRVIGKEQFDATLWNQAIATFAKAGAMSTNGEADLQRARILNAQGKKAEARVAAQDALRKGGLRETAAAQSLAK